MFDYQAGEKYRLTLIMVGVAGLVAGIFIALLLMPSPESSGRRHKGGGQSAKVMTNPDITGRRDGGMGFGSPDPSAIAAATAPGQTPGQNPQVSYVDRAAAHQFMVGWLPRVWDLSATTAAASQSEALRYMTPDCAAAYQRNVWTQDLARQVQESGLQSSFEIRDMQISEPQADGSVIIKVKGAQSLGSGGKNKTREVNLEYLMKQTPQGPRIAGISDSASR